MKNKTSTSSCLVLENKWRRRWWSEKCFIIMTIKRIFYPLTNIIVELASYSFGKKFIWTLFRQMEILVNGLLHKHKHRHILLVSFPLLGFHLLFSMPKKHNLKFKFYFLFLFFIPFVGYLPSFSASFRIF